MCCQKPRLDVEEALKGQRCSAIHILFPRHFALAKRPLNVRLTLLQF